MPPGVGGACENGAPTLRVAELACCISGVLMGIPGEARCEPSPLTEFGWKPID